MKILVRNRFAAEVATSSLNDIMFFLLLFFLIISTVANPNVMKVLLPQSNASESMHKQTIILTITPERQYFINKRAVSPNKLEEELIKSCAGLKDPTIVVRAAGNLPIQELVNVMQVGAHQKIKMVLATKRAE